MKIIPDKEEAINDIAQDDPDLKIFTDGSAMNDKIGASAVLYRDNRCKSSLQYQLGHISYHTVYEGEATGILLATNLILRELDVHTAIIYIDSRALTLATVLTAPSPGHYIIDTFHSAINTIHKNSPDYPFRSNGSPHIKMSRGTKQLTN